MAGLCESGNEPPAFLKAICYYVYKLATKTVEKRACDGICQVSRRLLLSDCACSPVQTVYPQHEGICDVGRGWISKPRERLSDVRQGLNGAERSTRLDACSDVSTDISKFKLRSSSTTGIGAYNPDTTGIDKQLI
ncbi:hypothetical protein ANN_03364 [Periplaneta americana]|uniref:Uncharacterized protein n=1 Tax=Periplaneta americana TaxID=6978 RepID=A0ABQ8TYR6_PERAM|nr:hypothetical protein ANN_03364 [Periplaneta americana]